jgi:hypothetical protein
MNSEPMMRENPHPGRKAAPGPNVRLPPTPLFPGLDRRASQLWFCRNHERLAEFENPAPQLPFHPRRPGLWQSPSLP